MPMAVGAAVLTTVGATTLAASATATYVVGSIVITGALVGASYATQTLSQQKPKRERQQATLNEAMGPRRFIYGQALVGGTRAFWDARHGMMYQCLMLCSHEIDGVAEYWIGDARVDTSAGEAGGNVGTVPYTGAVFYERYLGTPGQTAPTILLDRFPDVWTSAHRLRGIAHVCVAFAGVPEKHQQKVFPQGAYTVLRFVVRGKKLYDPSIGSMDPENPGAWVWGDNSGAVILDYLRDANGYRRSLAQIDMPAFVDFHAHCAENVPRKDGTPVGRYRTWGTIGFDEEPQAALARLCATCDATLYQGPSGKIGIRNSVWTGPLINISTQHITGAALTQGNDKLDSYNRLKVSYTDSNNYWQPTELVARDDLSSQVAIGVIEETRDLVMVPEFTQAARLQKIIMAKENPIWKGSIATDLMPLDALDQKAVDITFDPAASGYPLMNAPCEFTGFTLRGDVSGCDIGFRSVPASAFTWNAAVEEPPRPVTPVSIAQTLDIGVPASLTTGMTSRNVSNISAEITAWQWNPVTETNDPVYTPISDAVAGYYLTASWPAPYRADLGFDLEFGVVGSGVWQAAALADGALSAEVGPVTRATAYQMRLRHRSGSGNVSDWTLGATVTIP